jgi:uncharacterized membrane protein
MIIDAIKFRNSSDAKISLFKTVSWRIIGTIDTMIISFLLTRKLDIALSIGGIEIISKMVLYYFHERAWLKLLKR